MRPVDKRGHRPQAFLAVFVLGLVLLPAVVCDAPAAGPVAATEIKIGNILPLTGPGAPAGKKARCALEMATDAINASGGIKSMGGSKLVNVWADSAGDPSTGMKELARLVSREKVHLISGAWNSAVTYPTTEAAKNAGIPYVVPVSVRDSITERGFRHVFRLAPKDSWRARDQFRFLGDMKRSSGMRIEALAFVFEDGPWGVSMKDRWKTLAAAEGYRVVLTEAYPSSSPDLSATAMKIVNSSCDAVLVASIADDAVVLTKAMRAFKAKAAAFISSGGGHSDPSFIREAGDACEYLFDVSAWEPDMNRPDIAGLVREFGLRCGGSPTEEAVYEYVSVFVIARALEDARSTDPERIRRALHDLSVCSGKGSILPGILAQGCIEFDGTGQNRHAGHVMVQHLKTGGTLQRVTVWPPSAARRGFAPVFPEP